MTQNTMPQGFYVFQSSLGAPLEFHPALGTAELDEMVDAYVVGPAAIQDKRAAVSMDFFEHLSITGEAIKFYAIPTFSFGSTTSSPASMHDSGYGSSFSASPILPTWNWGQAASVPAQPLPDTQRHPAPARNSSVAPTRQQSTDFSHLPGMKILTKDGRDVTNAASRGCKTKEQRDHAHLMRIMKACDSCKRKKIRCDPSHKIRDAAKARSQAIPMSSNKTKVVAQRPQPQTPSLPMGADAWTPALSLPEAPQSELDMLDPVDMAAWENLVQLDQDIPVDYDWFNDPNGLFSPVSAASSTPMSQPFTPGSQQSASPQSGEDALLPLSDQLDSRPSRPPTLPTLPYLDGNSGPPHSYVDFNLYSPASSFSDEEPPVFAGDLSCDLSGTLAAAGDPGRDMDRTRSGSTSGQGGLSTTCSSPRVSSDRLQSLSDHEVAQAGLSRASEPLLTPSPTISSSQPTDLGQADTNLVLQQHSSSIPAHSVIRLRLSHGDFVSAATTARAVATTSTDDVEDSARSTSNVRTQSAATSTERTRSAVLHSTLADQSSQTGGVDASATTPCLARSVVGSGVVDSPSADSLSPTLNVAGAHHDLPRRIASVAATHGDQQYSVGTFQSITRNSRQHLSVPVALDSQILGAYLHLVALVSVFRWSQDKSTSSPTVSALLQPITLSLVAALAVIVLLHGIAALGYGSSMLGLKDSLAGAVLCSVAYATSRNSTGASQEEEAQMEDGAQASPKQSQWTRGMRRLGRESQKKTSGGKGRAGRLAVPGRPVGA